MIIDNVSILLIRYHIPLSARVCVFWTVRYCAPAIVAKMNFAYYTLQFASILWPPKLKFRTSDGLKTSIINARVLNTNTQNQWLKVKINFKINYNVKNRYCWKIFEWIMKVIKWSIRILLLEYYCLDLDQQITILHF